MNHEKLRLRFDCKCGTVFPAFSDLIDHWKEHKMETTLTLEDLTSDELCRQWSAFSDAVDQLRTDMNDREAEMLRRMRATGGTAMPNDAGLTVRLDHGTPTYDTGALRALEEALTEQEYSAVYSAPTTKTTEVPEKYSGTLLNQLERVYGPQSKVGLLIGRARIPGDARLRIERKKGA